MERKQGEKDVKKKNLLKEKSIKRYLSLTQLAFTTLKTRKAKQFQRHALQLVIQDI